MSGLTTLGFQPKTLSEVKSEIETSLRTSFGAGINLLPTEVLGQLVGIFSERETLIWELAEDVYNAFYPDTSNGTSLDNVVRITGITRLAATKSTGQVVLNGVVATVIPAGSIVSVSGNSAARFVTLANGIIAAGTDEIQTITFNPIPVSGVYKLVYNGDATTNLNWNDNAATVQTALNNLAALSGVVVAGSVAAGFTVTFAGADGSKPQPLLGATDVTLQDGGAVPTVITVTETTPGQLPNVTVNVQAETAGATPAYANTLTVIETPVGGWTAVYNPTDITIGKNIETDAQLRLRRLQTLAFPGVATIDAIRSRLLSIDAVSQAKVYENDTMNVVNLRPAKSFEAVVLNGADADIAAVIWANKPAGIQTYGNTTIVITDSQNIQHNVNFQRPNVINIHVRLTMTTDTSFPANGNDVIKQAIVDYADLNFGIGDDVIITELYCPAHSVPGIVTLSIAIGLVPNPVTTVNIAIDEREIADFDTSRITIV